VNNSSAPETDPERSPESNSPLAERRIRSPTSRMLEANRTISLLTHTN